MYRSKALDNYISNYFTMHNSRIVIMVQIILSMIKVGSVQQHKIAQGTSLKTKTNSIVRRIQRFFEQEFICPQICAKLIFSWFQWDKLINFTMDRTNWQFGVCDINVLVISGIYQGYAIPLCWTFLPHRGNSDTKVRIDLIEKLLLVVPLQRVGFLLADREFVGAEWFVYLQKTKIPFCIRLKENMLVTSTRSGKSVKLKSLFRGIAIGQARDLRQRLLNGLKLRICGTRTKDGELLILAISGDISVEDAFTLYGLRWTIESMFKAFKSEIGRAHV